MTLKRWIVGSGESVSLRDEADFRRVAGDDAVLLLSDGRPTLAWNSWAPASLWTSVGGTARLCGRDLRVELGADATFVVEHGNRIGFQAVGASPASLVGLLLPPERVRALARRELGVELDDPLVMPELVRDPEIHVALLRLAESSLREPENHGLAMQLVDEIIVRVLRGQSAFAELIERCPGRSARYRRQVFLRLLRARNHIEHVPGAVATLARLAEIAKLSPTHFLRLYRDVFGQTPHKHVVRVRLLAARELLTHSGLGVSAICRTLGFENRCAFARVFKQHFGVAPTVLRAQSAGAAKPALQETALLAA